MGSLAVLVLNVTAAHAQSHMGPAMTFDVATVRPNPHPRGWRMEFTADGFVAQGVPLRLLIKEAYGAYEAGRVLGGPGWLDTDHFDVQAKLDPAEVPKFAALSLSQRREMLQALLADRFQLKLHGEQRTFPAFALRVAEGGLKMHTTSGTGMPASSVKDNDALVSRSHAGLLEGRNFRCPI